MKDLAGLFAQIADTLPESAWCSLTKAQTLGALVVALRPRLIVELGVWTGDSLIPQLLALRYVASGKAVAIDPWSPVASVQGQDDAANVDWWGKVDHDRAFARFVERMARLDVAEICQIVRKTSDEFDPIELGEIDLLHIDGNHGDAAVRDVERYASRVPTGGILVMDDLDWSGGQVRRAHGVAKALGFVDLYPLGTGCVMRRTMKQAAAADLCEACERSRLRGELLQACDACRARRELL